MRSWRRNPEGGLEAELRSNRPEPSRELVHKLESRVRSHRDSRAGSFRVAFAGALAVGVLTALASVGGAWLRRDRREPGRGEGEANRAGARRDDAPQVGGDRSVPQAEGEEVPQGHEACPGQVQEGQEGTRRALHQAAVHRLGPRATRHRRGGFVPPRRTWAHFEADMSKRFQQTAITDCGTRGARPRRRRGSGNEPGADPHPALAGTHAEGRRRVLGRGRKARHDRARRNEHETASSC